MKIDELIKESFPEAKQEEQDVKNPAFSEVEEQEEELEEFDVDDPLGLVSMIDEDSLFISKKGAASAADLKTDKNVKNEEAGKRGKERKGSFRKVLKTSVWTSGIVLLTLVLLYIGFQLYASVIGEAEAETGATPGEEAIEPVITYTQEEVDELLAKALVAGVEMSDESLEKAEERGYQKGVDETLESIRAGFEEDKTIVEIFRPLYKNQMVVASNGKFHFVDINYDLKMNPLTPETLNITDSREFQYVVEDEVLSHKGIDVSSHQGEIDWEKVAGDGVEFAFIRAMYRGYGSGKLVEDETFDDNISGAIDHGIHVGAYVFSQAITEEEVLEEANLAIEKVKPYGNAIPIVIDVERVAGAKPRMDSLSKEERTHLVLLFCERVKEAGYKPMIYYNTEMSLLYVDIAQFEGIDKWFASYSSNLYYPYDFTVWQYSEKGRVSGIKDVVDMNISLSEFWKK